MPDIGIIGAGTAGLHLALLLQQAGITTKIYTDRTASQVAEGKPQNSVSHHAPTLARESALGVNHWPEADYGYLRHVHHLNVPDGPPAFVGDFVRPSRVLDYRIYLPRLMQDYEDRGGAIEIRAIEPSDFDGLAQQHDLLVVAAGKRSFGEYFGERPEMSPYAKPQRHLAVGFWAGVAQTDPRAVTLSVTPGVGELLDLPILTFDGFASALLFENIPGGPAEILMTQKEADDPEAYRALTLQMLRTHHPGVHERVDESQFRLIRPGDILAWRYSLDVHAEGESPYFAVFEADFPDAATLGAAMRSPQGQAVAADVPNYATGGAVVIDYPVDETKTSV